MREDTAALGAEHDVGLLRHRGDELVIAAYIGFRWRDRDEGHATPLVVLAT